MRSWKNVSGRTREVIAQRCGTLVRLLLCCACLLSVPVSHSDAQSAGSGARQAVAIVVNPHSTVSNLSFEELRRIFLGQQQFWADRSKITLLVRAPVAPERAVVLDQIYRMDEDQFRQYWIGKMFRAEIAGGPKIVYSSDMAMNLVGAIPGSIAFVLASAVTPNTKVLRIDGKLPSDAGYPLK
jgi:ABC-type phosphate transport system substrate-binding protein